MRDEHEHPDVLGAANDLDEGEVADDVHGLTRVPDRQSASAPNPTVEDLAPFKRVISIEMLREARNLELLSIADLPRSHGLGERLDDAIGGGLERGDILLIGAPGTGAGKTAFALQLVDGFAFRSIDLVRRGAPGPLTPILIVSELKPSTLAYRTIGRCANVSPRLLRAGRTAERLYGVEETDRAFVTAESIVQSADFVALRDWQLVIPPPEDRNKLMEQIKSKLNALRDQIARANPGREIYPIAFIDPIQRWQAPGVGEVEALNVIAEDLDLAADREGWIVVSTSDTNKGTVTGESDSDASVFRGSMKLLHAADIALILKPGNPVPDPGRARQATVKIFKGRNGGEGITADFYWYAARSLRFEPREPAQGRTEKQPTAADQAKVHAKLYDLVACLREVEPVSKNKLRTHKGEIGIESDHGMDGLVDEAVAADVLTVEQRDRRGRILALGLGTRPSPPTLADPRTPE